MCVFFYRGDYMEKEYKEYQDTVELSEMAKDILDKYPACIIGNTTGVGKTFISIRASYLISKDAILLVFAHPVSKIKSRDWEKSVEAFNKAMNASLEVYTFSYPTLYSKSEKKLNEINEVLLKGANEKRPVIVIADEAQKLKINTAGKYTSTNKQFKKLASSEYVDKIMFLSGSPIGNSYLDAAFYLICAGFYKNITQFKREQILFYDERHNPVVKNKFTKKVERSFFKDADLLDHQLKEITVYKDTDYLLPDFTEYNVMIDMNDNFYYVNRDLKEQFHDTEPRTSKGHTKAIKRYFKEGGYEHLASYTRDLKNVCHRDINKLKALGKILNNVFSSEDPHPVLIFYQYNLTLEVIDYYLDHHFKTIEKRYVNGKVKDVDTPKNPYTVILIQYLSGGAAIEFPTSKTTIYYAPPQDSYIDFTQAKGRARRARLTHHIQYYKFILKDSEEEKTWNRIENKTEFINTVTDKWL